MGVVDDADREAAFFRDVMDPFVRAVLEAEDPWDAYQSIASMRGAMTDYLDWGPHGGEMFVAWADLEDLYDKGKTPLSDAHGASVKLRPNGLPGRPCLTLAHTWRTGSRRPLDPCLDSSNVTGASGPSRDDGDPSAAPMSKPYERDSGVPRACDHLRFLGIARVLLLPIGSLHSCPEVRWSTSSPDRSL